MRDKTDMKDALKEIEKLRREGKIGPPVINLDLPMPHSGPVESALKSEKVEAKPAAEVKPDQLSDAAREKLLSIFIEKYRTRRGVTSNNLLEAAFSCGFSDPWRYVSPFLEQLQENGEITKTGRTTEHGNTIYEFTERGVAKYVDQILEQGSHERLLTNFIDLLRSGREVDVGAFVGTCLDRPGEALAFLTRMFKVGEMEKTEEGKYKFTAAALDKYTDQVFWYPAFKLMRNPFVTFEARIERGEAVVRAPMFERVGSLISAKSSAIIEGERGCGKTSVIAHFAAGGHDITTSISPRSVSRIKDALRERTASKIGEDGKKITDTAEYSGIYHLTPDQREKYKTAVDEVARCGHLFDAPDNFSHKDAFKLADICAGILDKGGFVIFFATLEQARMLKRLDTFARFPVVKFERPGDDFFVELFSSRVRRAQPAETPLPFENGVIKRVAEAADHNPRRFILMCSRLLTEMRERKMDRPLDEKAVDELLKDADVLAEAPTDITEALGEIMREAGSGGAKWVKVKDIRAALIERYGIDIRPETIGRRLTGMGCQRRYSPDAEYLAQG